MERIKYIMELINKNLMLINETGYVFDDGGFDDMLHSYGVAYFTAASAFKRGLDPEIGYIIGLLHDLGRIVNDDYSEAHGITGALMVQKVLADSGLFDESEIGIIYASLSKHSKKNEENGPYEEVLKDADLFERIFFMADYGQEEINKKTRVNRILGDFGLKIQRDED